MILSIQSNEAIIYDPGGEEGVSVTHAHEVDGVAVEDGDHLEVVEGRLIQEALVPQAEVD